jgi:hypothetical protein
MQAAKRCSSKGRLTGNVSAVESDTADENRIVDEMV